jgi:hypothetical protein
MVIMLTPKTRLKKFARYRRQITQTKTITSQNRNSSIVDPQARPSLTLQILMYGLVGGVIILLILVVALIYFER